MTKNYKHAYGFCDRTGFRYDLKDLVPEFEDGRPNGLRVGRDMEDRDQEQYKLDELKLNDPQPLTNPRPEVNVDESRALWSWDPVGQVGLEMRGEVGRVTVTTS